MVPIKVKLDNDDHYVGGNTKQYIVIHDTGNLTDSDEGNANYFCTGSRNSSAHYFVDNDSITQVVLDNDCSWHCGDGRGVYGITNINSIGIEMCRVNGTVTPITEANTIELVKMLMNKYNIPVDRVVRHYDASRKICPSSLSANNWERWYIFKSKLSSGGGKVKNLVVYNNYIDRRPAERLSEHLQCPTLNAEQVKNFDYSCVENPIGVGGGSFDPAVKVIIKGVDRDETDKAVLKYIGRL